LRDALANLRVRASLRVLRPQLAKQLGQLLFVHRPAAADAHGYVPSSNAMEYFDHLRPSRSFPAREESLVGLLWFVCSLINAAEKMARVAGNCVELAGIFFDDRPTLLWQRAV
jgi:hypothetical protein